MIVGWNDKFRDFEPEILKVKVERLLTFGVTQINLAFSFKICNKDAKIKFAELMFMECQNFDTEMYFPSKGDCEIVMSKMADGRIYVGFDGLGIAFICASVLEYDYYCNRDED